MHNTDVDECEDDAKTCHQCMNFNGGFDCGCNDGYYHSPAAGTCYGESEFSCNAICIDLVTCTKK